MIEVISGTDRPGSNSLKVANIVLAMLKQQQVQASLLDLSQINLADAAGAAYKAPQGSYEAAVERVNIAHGVIFVVPEYNGSFPGALKLFIDYWRYPQTFENRPFAFVGLGGRWGGLRPVEHLQQVIGYRNGYQFPNRVFLTHVDKVLRDGQITDPMLAGLLDTQIKDFVRFIKALQSQKLDAHSRLHNSK